MGATLEVSMPDGTDWMSRSIREQKGRVRGITRHMELVYSGSHKCLAI